MHHGNGRQDKTSSKHFATEESDTIQRIHFAVGKFEFRIRINRTCYRIFRILLWIVRPTTWRRGSSDKVSISQKNLRLINLILKAWPFQSYLNYKRASFLFVTCFYEIVNNRRTMEMVVEVRRKAEEAVSEVIPIFQILKQGFST